jgi:hypothetical protein
MKVEFLSWYKTVSMSLEPSVTDACWAEVQALAASATNQELEALVRAAFRAKQSSAMTNAVRAKLAGKGAAIQDEEFTLLAAATLAVILNTGQQTAARAATMITSAHVSGLRVLKLPMDIIGLASSTRSALARTTRQRPPLTLKPMPSMSIDASKATASDDQNEGLELLAHACSEVLEALADRQCEFERRALHCISIQDEELNMLWWLQGGQSETTKLPFAEVPREQRPFVLARELAEATYALPGAAAIESLLARAGIDDGEPVGIAAAVQSLPLDWLKKAIPDNDFTVISSVTTPFHEAFKRRLEVDGQDTWIPNWASVCGLEPSAQLSPLQLALLCYCEQLLICK